MKLNKKMIIMLASVVGVLVVLVIILMLFVGGGSKKLSYEKIEEKLLSAGESYYEDNDGKLPENGSTFVSSDVLVEEGYIKELSSYTDEDVTCEGKVYAIKNPSGYTYRSNLDCGKHYKTKTLSSVVKENVVTSGSGLYEEEQINPNNNSEMHTVYVFKGDNVNNYVKVGDFYWQIVKIYENGDMAVLDEGELFTATWDNRYNIDEKKYVGINEYEVSRVYDSIQKDVVKNDGGYLKIKGLITSHNACVGKRLLSDISHSGEAECSEILENQYFSLLPAYDYLNASLDENCGGFDSNSCYNYNYLTFGSSSWLITAVSDNTSEVYYFTDIMKKDSANQRNESRLYAHFDASVTYVSGSGTYEDPYIVK